MHRRIALATVACALALPAGALAAEPAATGAGSVGLKPASGLKVTSLKASKSGRTVTAKVRWDRALIVRKAERERFTVRLLSGPAGQRRVLGTVSRRAPKGTSENVRFRLNARNARRVKSSSRVFATATQQFDSPDTGRLYELNHVSIASMKGKRPFTSAAASSCPTEIKPNTDMTGCQLPGANLAGADLSGVKFNQANLEVSNLASAWLETTDLTQADLTGASLIGAKMSPSEQSARTFPDDGDQIGKLIDSAQTSVDVIIYEIGGQNIVGQPGSPGALMRAVQRGVNVRVIVNSGNKGCTGFEDDKQAVCLGLPGADAYYAVEAALKSAADSARAQGKTPGNYRVQFSSQNYQITHQKSILIDTSDHNGNALTKDQMGTNSKVLVSTGNLQSYGWGGYEYYNKNKNKWVVTNEDYLTNPAKSCLDGNSKPISPCADEWAARDFAIEVTESELKARIAAVFAADQTCAKWEDTQVYQDLLGSNLADTWANGTLIAAGTTYPTGGKPDFYAGFGPNKLLQPDPDKPGQIKPQGNSRKRQLDLIASAKETLIVYNEEMDDPDMINALADRARNNVDVRVVMSATFDKATGKPKPSNELPVIQKDGTVKPGTGNYKFSYLISNGVKVKFFCSGNPNTPCPDNLRDSLYIHAKAIVADGVNAFMGSENFGYASLNYNRELGLMLSNSTDSKVWTAPSIVSVGGVAAIMTAFSKDWNSSDAVPYTAQTPLVLPFAGYPKDAPYPQPPAGTPFTDDSGAPEFNLACVPPQGGNPYAPALAARKLPPQT